MKRLKTISGLLALVILCTSLISGCGSKTTTDDGEVPTLTWYVPGNKQEDMAAVMKAANAISEQKIGAKLSLEMIDSGSFDERLNLMMSSQKEFDLCFTGYLNRYINAVQKGGFYDMTEDIENSPALKNALPDYAWKAATIDGKIYGVPNLQIMATAHGVYVQKKYIDKYAPGLTEIEDESDLEPFFDAVKADNPNLYPSQGKIQPYGIWYDTYEPVLIKPHVVAKWDDPEHKMVWLPSTPEFQEVLQLRRRWYEKGYVRPDVDTATVGASDYANEKYIIQVSNWKPGAEVERANSGNPEEVFLATNKVVLPNEAGRDTMIAISATSKHPEKSVKMIELLNTDKEFYNTICFGIEGEHYTRLENGNIKLDKESGYYQNAAWKFGNQFNAYLTGNQPADVWEQTAKMNDEAERSQLIGFIPDTRPITTEIAQCTAIDTEYGILNTCSEPYEEIYKEYVQRMEAAGINKIVDELNRQVTEWLKTQK